MMKTTMRATQRGSAPFSTSQAAGTSTDRTTSTRAMTEMVTPSAARPRPPREAHAQAVPGSLAETRGRSFADRRSPVRCRR